jgi:hypothetical protein
VRRPLLLSLLVGTAALARPQVQATPSTIVLGRDHEVRLEVKDAEQLHWKVSEGDLTQTDATHWVWHAPDSGVPRTALLLVWDAADAPPDPTVVRIPLIGRTDLAIDTEPLAVVTVEIAGQTFGPRTASASGKVRVPVQVPPDAETAAVHAESNGRATDRRVPLGMPTDVRVVAALSPHPLAPDEGGWLLVAGVPALTAEQTRLEVTGATLRPELATDPLRYAVTPLPDASEVAVTAERKGRPASRTMTAVAVGLLPPAAPCPVSSPMRGYLGASAGAFFGRGAARGVEGSIAAGLSWGPHDRVGLELEVGIRHTGLTQEQPGLGTLRSSINVLPVLASVRVVPVAAGHWRLGLRAGVGVAPYEHRLTAAFQQPFREGGVTWQLAGGIEGAYRVGAWAPFIELGYAYSPTLQTTQVNAELRGPRALLGLRGWLP